MAPTFKVNAVNPLLLTMQANPALRATLRANPARAIKNVPRTVRIPKPVQAPTCPAGRKWTGPLPAKAVVDAAAAAREAAKLAKYEVLIMSRAPATGRAGIPTPGIPRNLKRGFPNVNLAVPTVSDRRAALDVQRRGSLLGLNADTNQLPLMQAAIAQIRVAADQADKYVRALAFWTDSSVKSAAKEFARQTRKGIDVMTQKLARLTAGGRTPTPDEVTNFFDTAKVFADVKVLAETAANNNTANMAAAVARDSAADAAVLAQKALDKVSAAGSAVGVAGLKMIAPAFLGLVALIAIAGFAFKKSGVRVETPFVRAGADANRAGA